VKKEYNKIKQRFEQGIHPMDLDGLLELRGGNLNPLTKVLLKIMLI
jgi:hypothetical protein